MGSTETVNRDWSPQQTAVLMIDLQEGFIGTLSPFDIPSSVLLESCARLLATTRALGIKVIWTRVYLDDWNHSPYSELWPGHFGTNGPTFLKKGSRSFQLCEAIEHLVEDADLIIDKPRYSAFIATDLDETLRRFGIEQLLFCGVTTNVCVESSIRDAMQLGYYSKIVRDCTATFSQDLQQHSEHVISMVFGDVIESGDLAKHFLRQVKSVEHGSVVLTGV